MKALIIAAGQGTRLRSVVDTKPLASLLGLCLIERVILTAKKSGIETGDVFSEFKIENLDRPNKAIVYPFSILLLFGFGYLNYRRDKI